MTTSSARTSLVNVGVHPEGGWVVAVIAKRTYSIVAGRAAPAEQQLPLVEGPLYSEDGALLLHDSDCLLNRQLVDVVIAGHAYPAQGYRTLDARLRVGGELDLALRISGDRRCWVDVNGTVRFTEPAVTDRIPLGWHTAYGGVDALGLEVHGCPIEDLAREARLPYDPRFGLHGYPRNPFGKGYATVITAANAERVELPNVEFATQMLTPEKLPRGDYDHWPRGPLPASLGWLPYNLFPRATLGGLPPPIYDRTSIRPEDFVEVYTGAVPARSLAPEGAAQDRVDVRITQGSAIGMRARYVGPGVPIELEGLHPKIWRWGFELPHEVPQLVLGMPDERPEELSTAANRTLWLDPDNDRFAVVWIAERKWPSPIGPNKFQKIHHAVRWNRG